jgi:hypothetical protein
MVSRVNEIVNRTKAVVVATTNWRIEYSRAALEQILAQAGATFPLHSTTPVLGKPRGLEVRAWLEGLGEDVEAFAILDDLPREDFDDFGRTNLITTDSNVGLTDIGVRRTILLLQQVGRGYRRDSSLCDAQGRLLRAGQN